MPAEVAHSDSCQYRCYSPPLTDALKCCGRIDEEVSDNLR